ncbi:hypothetical protein B0I00_2169 [Novosphingobium kunmingense]|uniref:Uncharacterized protein n=1 Tax=Novosphingobium kunmingense TaxID=1211806 RepID=A0A2N0H6M2_9SPHN|nr:hypothetical protein [Novosphingobium kunmingense]PKB14572.1 hypothetical protein B0I00_2169 [Novosphingobium kunmingense]
MPYRESALRPSLGIVLMSLLTGPTVAIGAMLSGWQLATNEPEAGNDGFVSEAGLFICQFLQKVLLPRIAENREKTAAKGQLQIVL